MLKLNLRDKTGTAFIELALVLPLLSAMLIGAAELGRIAYFAIEVSNAARAGVAYGAQNHNTASDITDMKTAAKDDAPDLPGLVPTADNCICPATAATSTVLACSFPASATETCSSFTTDTEFVYVNTSATVTTLFHYPVIPRTFTLTGFAQMRVEQD